MVMPRYAARADTNHVEIKNDFISMGFEVVDTRKLGEDFPDLIISRSLITAAIEIKRDKKAKLSDGQLKFHMRWKGHIFVVTDHEDAIKVNQIMMQEAEYRVRGFRG